MRVSGGCPGDQVVSAFVEGLLSEADRASVIGHVDGCPRCTAQVAALAALLEATPSPVPASLLDLASGRRSPWPVRLATCGAVAASLLLAVTLWPTRELSEPAIPTTPGTGSAVRATQGEAGVVVQTPVDNEPLAPGFDVGWQGPNGAVFFEVQITTADGDLLWSTQVDGAARRVVVPTALSATQPSYLWVTAHLPQGRRVSSNVIRIRGRSAN